MDTISRAAAIDAVSDGMCSGWDCDVIEKLKALPSAHPEERTEERTETHACDLISRQDAIEIASGYCHPANIAKELAKLPSAQQWTPCSERLPEEEKKHYWVCTDTGYQCKCRWTNINHFWTDLTTDWHWHIMDIPQYSGVIAWMSLPEPYKERREE